MAGLNDMISEGGSLSAPSLSDAVGGSSNKDLMTDARMSLSGIWMLTIFGTLLFLVLIGSISFFMQAILLYASTLGSTAATVTLFVLSIFSLLLSGALAVGFYSFFLVISQEGEVRPESLFTGFKRLWASLAVYVFSSLFIMLWSVLLVIPGIIAMYQYSMVYYIVADDETVGPFGALRQSREMMQGNKWKLFCLQWRFFGWAILAALTGGIGTIWLVPYMQTSFAKFYEDVK